MQIEKGFLRRVDELGRIVIPKELRECLKIEQGCLLEFGITNDNTVLMKKYSKMQDIKDFANNCLHIFNNSPNWTVCVCDLEKVIACSNNYNNTITNCLISAELKKIINNRQIIEIKKLNLCENYAVDDVWIFPIIANADVYGAVIIKQTENKNDVLFIGKILTNFLACYIEK